MNIKKAERIDLCALAGLAMELWPEHERAALEAKYVGLVDSEEAACFLATDAQTAVGFAQCQLRHDYVEGTRTSPVGYLEGIYVAVPYRKKGIARALLAACQDWAKEQGCLEFASDCELDNEQSQRFHRSVGFQEANRIVCFTKNL